MRCFVGIKIPPNEKIIEFQNEIKKNYQVKLVEPNNLHSTLKFLGEIDNKNLEKILIILRRMKFKKFEIEIKGAGAFPKENHARVIWLGLNSTDLNELGQTISTLLKDYGEDKFSPHLTVGRLKNMANVSELISAFKNVVFGYFEVKSFEVYKSTLTPQGPIYDEIEKIVAED